ncbi:MAG: single-stranded-DNA-specific exonuclease RecJ [Candidatus Falkowbacteria bacterium]
MKQWQLYPAAPEEFLISRPDLSPLVLQLLYNRGLKEFSALEAFLHDILPLDKTLDIAGVSDLRFYDPFLFKNMAAAVDLIIANIKTGNKIVVYGDYDADGVTSSVILLETLKILQAKVEVYLPDRVTEGYGLNRIAIDQIAEQGFSLVITVDNGIRNKEEVEYAKSKGLEVIITDHHILPELASDLPPCLIINPADKNDSYAWPYLAGVGVSFKLVSALVHKSNLPLNQKRLIMEKSLDLVAVGTIADMVSLLGENRLLVKRGLQLLNQGKRQGLNELVKISKSNGNKKLEAWNVGWQIGPRLNAASRIGHANSAFALLTAETEASAFELAAELNQRNLERQKITEEIISQVELQIDPKNIPPIIIGLAAKDQSWNEGVIGLVAGRICEKYYRPTLIITRITESVTEGAKTLPKTSFKSSGRSIEDLNLIASISEASEFLDKYGGHPMACGFSVESEERLEKFIEKIKSIAAEKLAGKELSPRLRIESELKIENVNLDLAEEILTLAPYGQNNPQPKFVSYNLRVDEIMTLGFDSQHIKFRLSPSDRAFAKGIWAISFGSAQEYKAVCVGDLVDAVYYLDINDFNGRREAQLRLVDLRPAKENN